MRQMVGRMPHWSPSAVTRHPRCRNSPEWSQPRLHQNKDRRRAQTAHRISGLPPPSRCRIRLSIHVLTQEYPTGADDDFASQLTPVIGDLILLRAWQENWRGSWRMSGSDPRIALALKLLYN